MVCTIFPLFIPITVRLIYIYFPKLLQFVLELEGMPLVQMLGFASADVLLLALSLLDWRAYKGIDVFPLAFLLLGLFQFSVLTLYKFSVWRQIGDRIMNLPL
jgi:hypothetical protein